MIDAVGLLLSVLEAGGGVSLVDDNQDAADMLASLVEHLGYEAMVAHDGPSALELS